jgi:uncharacterized protein (UPF0548 family)
LTTTRVPDPRPPPGSRWARALEQLRGAPLNFDPSELWEARAGARWQYDERLQPLAPEAPGPPVSGGTWEVVRELMRGYQFADPSIVRAYYDPETPLEGRTMLLVARFWGLRFPVGCRVGEVQDRTDEVGGAPVRLWGWSYRTLAGHFEQGEMHWAVLKWPDTGEVSFRIRAWSRRSRDPNPIVRIGFRLFGRREQLRFYDGTCARVLRLSAERSRGRAINAR